MVKSMERLTISYFGYIGALILSLVSSSYAQCTIEGKLSMLGGTFPAIQTVRSRLESCTGGDICTWLTRSHSKVQKTIKPTVYIASNSQMGTLLGNDAIRKLDDLVQKYGKHLKDSQLMKVQGKTYAIAFIANAQYFVYRKDIFEKHGLDVPNTYDDMMQLAKQIQSRNISQTPVGGLFKSGWNLAQEFNNLYLASGGALSFSRSFWGVG